MPKFIAVSGFELLSDADLSDSKVHVFSTLLLISAAVKLNVGKEAWQLTNRNAKKLDSFFKTIPFSITVVCVR